MVLRNFLFGSLFILFAFSVKAQEHITDSLASNATIHQRYLKWSKKQQINNKSGVPLSLPFQDDFNQKSSLPDQNKWQDINVYINSDYAKNPLSIGVATFDGLDSTGYPYNFVNPTAEGTADSLTSLPIDLSGADSVYLSFAYQPQGLGNAPEEEDSLVLEFYNPATQTWNWRWSVEGNTVQPFKKVLLYVDTSYYKSTFQFRFLNYATLSGDLDIWNLDFVYLDKNRTYNDTALFDVAYQYLPKTMINDYTAMPYSHFEADTAGNMRTDMDLVFKNNTNATQNIFYKQKISDRWNTQLDIYPTGLGTFFIISPNSSYTLNIPVNSGTRNFAFNKIDSCANYYNIQSYFGIGSGSSSDDWPENDTAFTQQIFNPYYAYDDGSAEAAYYMQSSGDEAAVEFNSNISDTITAIDIYFDPSVINATAYTFNLDVWSSLNPETKIYSSTNVCYPQYSNKNQFVRYYLESPVIVQGDFYIGWDKVSSQHLNVGFDVNNDNHLKNWYNLGSGFSQSSIPGSIMIRPVFGTCKDLLTAVKKNITQPNIKLFPNPANNEITICGTPNKTNCILNIYNISGEKILQQTISQNKNTIRVNSLPTGLYIGIIYNEKNHKMLMNKKFVISH